MILLASYFSGAFTYCPLAYWLFFVLFCFVLSFCRLLICTCSYIVTQVAIAGTLFYVLCFVLVSSYLCTWPLVLTMYWQAFLLIANYGQS